MKATKLNYYKLCEVMYNLTGLVYWLHKSEFDGQMKENFFACFWEVRKEIKTRILSGECFRYPLIKAINGNAVPYIGNSLKLF